MLHSNVGASSALSRVTAMTSCAARRRQDATFAFRAMAYRLEASGPNGMGSRIQSSLLRDSGYPENAPPRPVLRAGYNLHGGTRAEVQQCLDVLRKNLLGYPGADCINRVQAQSSDRTGTRVIIRVCYAVALPRGEPYGPGGVTRAMLKREMRNTMTRQHSRPSGVAGREVESAAHAIAAQVLGSITLR